MATDDLINEDIFFSQNQFHMEDDIQITIITLIQIYRCKTRFHASMLFFLLTT